MNSVYKSWIFYSKQKEILSSLPLPQSFFNIFSLEVLYVPMKLSSSTKVRFQNFKKKNVDSFFLASPLQFYPKELALKVNIRHPAGSEADIKFDLKLLVIGDV